MHAVFADADLAAIAELMTGQRATLLLALLSGQELAASELATRAGLSRSLTSSHLSRLLDGGLIAVRQQGRQRYYRLGNADVAEVIEAMLTIAPHVAASSLRESSRGAAIRHARTCYDHLAGKLGVALTETLERQHLIQAVDSAYLLTDSGHTRLENFGLDTAALRRGRRSFARPCLDWSERRAHLAGALGAGIAETLLKRDWIRRIPNTRALSITTTGRRGLRRELGLNLPD